MQIRYLSIVMFCLIQGPGEASLFLGASVFFAIKDAITNARLSLSNSLTVDVELLRRLFHFFLSSAIIRT